MGYGIVCLANLCILSKTKVGRGDTKEESELILKRLIDTSTVLEHLERLIPGEPSHSLLACRASEVRRSSCLMRSNVKKFSRPSRHMSRSC